VSSKLKIRDKIKENRCGCIYWPVKRLHFESLPLITGPFKHV